MILWLLTLLGFFLRFWKLEYGLPNIFYIDEGHHVFWALNLGKDLNPHVFLQPTLYFYLSFLGDALYTVVKLASGSFHSASDAWRLYKNNPAVYYVIGRGVSALLGTLTIPVLYYGVKRCFGRSTGYLAALFLTAAFLHVQYSQIGYLDASLAFFITLSFCFAAAAFKKGRRRDFALAGLAGGLAASTKYTGFSALIFGPAALILAESGSLSEKKSLRNNFIFFACFFVGFTAGTPYWILSFPEFRDNFLVMFGDYKSGGRGQLGYEGKWNWFYYLKEPLRYGLGLPLQCAGFAGILLSCLRPERKKLFFLSFPVAYFIFIGISDIRQARYMVPLVPFFCGAAALAVMSAVDSPGKYLHLSNRVRTAGKWIFAVFLLLPSLLNILTYNHLKTVPDTRQLAHKWMKQNLPQEASILQTVFAFAPQPGPATKIDYLDLTAFDTRLQHRSTLKTLAEYRKEGWRYLLLDDWHTEIILTGARRNPRYSATGQKYRDFLAELQKDGAEPLVIFSPYEDPTTPVDVENVEFASKGLQKMKRFGPKITLYKL